MKYIDMSEWDVMDEWDRMGCDRTKVTLVGK